MRKERIIVFSIKVLKNDGETKFVARGEREVCLVVTSAYEEGDRIVLEYAGAPQYFRFQADDALGAGGSGREGGVGAGRCAGD